MDSFDKFDQLNLPPGLLIALHKMEFVSPTPIQALSIPPALTGRDILGTAQTGTGKTGAFAIPMLANLYHGHVKQALVLAPTRELAAQIITVLKKMGKELGMRGTLVVGGESFQRQEREIRDGVDFIVATPGRLNDHLMERTVRLDAMEYVVLDEVDRMLDMGFAPQIRKIMQKVPEDRQTLLFSATLPASIASMAHQYLHNPVRTDAGNVEQTVSQVTESTIETTNNEKIPIVLKEVKTREGKILIFTKTQDRCEVLSAVLEREGFPNVSLHGGKTQGERKRALDQFKKGDQRIMVATDLAGRGIDVIDIEHVINYDLPNSREDYIHRIGRTGRNGRTGLALNLITPADIDGDLITTGERVKAKTMFGSTRRSRRR